MRPHENLMYGTTQWTLLLKSIGSPSFSLLKRNTAWPYKFGAGC